MRKKVQGHGSDNQSLALEDCVQRIVVKNLSHGLGYIETAPMRFYFEQLDPQDQGSRVITRIVALSDMTTRSEHTGGALRLARIIPTLRRVPEDVDRDRRVQQASAIDPCMLEPIPDMELELALNHPSHFSRIPARVCDDGQAVLPNMYYRICTEDDGSPSWCIEDFIEAWNDVPETADTPEENEARKITVFMEHKIFGWCRGWK